VPSNRAAAHWRAAEVLEVRRETRSAVTLRLAVPGWAPHHPGQHVMVRLTAADGYTAQRHYSIASPPDDADAVEITVDLVPDGEVSGHLAGRVRPGDVLEVRGPFGGFFAWPGDRPALLLGGGSGVVPLMSMVRHHRRRALDVPLRMVVSARTPQDLLYAEELGPETAVRFTRHGPDARRLAAADLAPLLAADTAPGTGWNAYICGSNGFAEHAARLLTALGQPRERIRIERFGGAT
jgi:ferredoxin-NADP reductase